MVRAELMIIPDAETLKARCWELWAYQTNHSPTRTLAMLEAEYADYDALPLPALKTIKHWITAEGWVKRADEELARDYPEQVRAFQRGVWRARLLSLERTFDVLTGTGRPMGKEESALIQRLWQMSGIGTYGANQGGEMGLEFGNEGAAEAEALSLEQRARKVRAMMSERSRQAGS